MHDKSKITYVDGVVQSRGIIIYAENNGERKYLIIKSKVGDHWTFAKGHWLLGESELDCAKREVKEEVGISDIEIISGFETSIRYVAYDEDKIVKFYLGKVSSENVTIDNIEVCDYKWLSFKDAYNLITHDRTKKPLEEAEDFLNKK